MENKKLLEFVEYFNTLHCAGDILLSISEYEGLQQHSYFINHTEEVKAKIVKKIHDNWEILSKYDPAPLSDEIWKNLFDDKIDKRVYIIYVLRQFGAISSYLNLGNEVRVNFRAIACSNVIRRIDSYTFDEHTKHLINGTLYNHEMERYVDFCHGIVLNFLTALDCKCHDFGYDIIEIQKEAGFCVYKQSSKIMKRFNRYGLSYTESSESENTRTDDERRTKENKKQEDITNHLKLDDRKELIKLFHGNTYLLNDLVGKSDDEIVSLIGKWARTKDDENKPLIENPQNNLKSKFAQELKRAGFIKCTENTFRTKL